MIPLRKIGATAPLVLSIIFGCSGGSHNVNPEPDAGDTDTDSANGIPGWRMTWALNEGSVETLTHAEVGEAVVALEDGDAVVGGRFFPGAVFAEGLPEEVEPPQYGDVDGFLAWYSPAGKLRRLRTIGGGGQEIIHGVSAVTSGGVAACSLGIDMVHLDPGSPGEEPWLVDMGLESSFLVARYDAQGTLMWERHPSESNGSFSMNTALLDDSTIVTVGAFLGDLSFKVVGEKVPITIQSTGNYDMFGVAHTLDGELLWLRKLAGSGSNVGKHADAYSTPDGGFLVASGFSEEVVVGQNSPNEVVLDLEAGSSVFVAKYDSGGIPEWAFDVGIEGDGEWGRIDVSPSGDFVLSAEYRGSVTIQTTRDGEINLESGSGGTESSLMLASYTYEGKPLWVRSVGPVPPALPSYGVGSVSLMPGGEIAVCGLCKEGTIFAEGEPTETVIPDGIFHAAFTALYGPEGDFRWVVHHGKYGLNNCLDIDTLGDDTIFSTGGFWGEDVAFGTSPEDAVYLSGKGGTQDIYVTRMDRVAAPR